MGLLARLLESSSALEIVGRTFSLVDLSEVEVRELIADLSSEYVGLLLLVDVARQAKRLSRRKERSQENWSIVHRMSAASPDTGHRILVSMSRQVMATSFGPCRRIP
jgi:hypothetical protein